MDRRLHRSAIGAEALQGLRQLALPILVVAVLGGGMSSNALVRGAIFGLLGIAFTVVLAVVQWQTTRWRVDGEVVRLRRGVLSETVTTIPLERVQSIDTVRGPVQRLFGSVELHVQSAGGGRAGEIVLKAVSPAEADELRERVRVAAGEAPADGFATAPEAPVAVPGAPPAGPSWRLGPRPLVLAAVTSGSLGVIVPVVAGASQVLDDVLGREEAERLVPSSIVEVALLAGAVLVVAWVLSVLGTIVAFAGFTAQRDGERLRIRRGIIERREASVPVARIHALRIIESPLRQPLGFAQVRVESAGYADEPATAQTLLPLVRRRDLPRVLGELLPELAGPLDGLEPLPSRALRRHLTPPLAVAAALAAAATVAFGPTGLAALILLPLAGALGVARHRAAGWRVDGDRVVLRSRRLARTTSAADTRRLQAVRTQATVFQRRGSLATFAVDVSSGRRLRVTHVDAAVADGLLAQLGPVASEGSRSGGLAGTAG